MAALCRKDFQSAVWRCGVKCDRKMGDRKIGTADCLSSNGRDGTGLRKSCVFDCFLFIQVLFPVSPATRQQLCDSVPTGRYAVATGASLVVTHNSDVFIEELRYFQRDDMMKSRG